MDHQKATDEAAEMVVNMLLQMIRHGDIGFDQAFQAIDDYLESSAAHPANSPYRENLKDARARLRQLLTLRAKSD